MQLEQHKQYSTLDQFRIIKKLGSGLQATVKLAENLNGLKVAIKKYKTQRSHLEALQNQIKIIKHLNHQNIITLIDCRPQAKYTKKDGTQYTCMVIIFQYAGGGQLFDYIADSGRFSQKVTRSYFGQLMNGLHHMHSKGFVHRDLKPENLLLSEFFMLKIGDFGFSCDKLKHNGILQSKLGTHGYMAPQIYEKKYNGEKTDVFAAGVILFVMLVGMSPFNKAIKQDTFYSFIINKQYDKFWKEFEKRRGKNFFNNDFKELIQRMIAFDPAERMNIVQIAQHPWIKGQIPDFNDLLKEFEERKKKVAEAIEKRRVEEEKKKKDAKEQINLGDGNIRGLQATDVDNFAQELRAEEHRNRKVLVISEPQFDDWVINQQLPYTVVRLKQFLSSLQLDLQSDPFSQPTSGNKSQLLHLQRLQDCHEHEILAQLQFENSVGDQEETLVEKLVVRFILGRDVRGYTVLRCITQDGDWFYCRRFIQEVRNIFGHNILSG